MNPEHLFSSRMSVHEYLSAVGHQPPSHVPDT